jgi:predicted peroxiredoxin
LDEDEEIVKSFLIETILLSSQRFDSKITITSKGLVFAEKDDMSKIRRKIPFSRLKAVYHMNWEGRLFFAVEVIDENPEIMVQ